MNTPPSRRPPLADALVTEIAADILAGRLPPGTALPPEPQLCERFGVSRTVVREAVVRLQRIGVLGIRRGIGTTVLARTHWHELDPELLWVRAATGLIGDLVPDLLAVRRMVEVEVAGEAALSRSDVDLSRMASLIEAMLEAGDSPVAQTDADIAFHEALIIAGGNRIMREMMRPINQIRRIGSILTTSTGPSIIVTSIAGHQSIFDAVAAGDARAARQAMTSHIGQFERELHNALTSPVYQSMESDGGYAVTAAPLATRTR